MQYNYTGTCHAPYVSRSGLENFPKWWKHNGPLSMSHLSATNFEELWKHKEHSGNIRCNFSRNFLAKIILPVEFV